MREALGRGAPATIADALTRFWRDLGIKAECDPAPLTRMPAEIADLADGLWQKALALSSQAAKHEENPPRERLEQLRLENEICAQSFALREKELDVAAPALERALLRVLARVRATHTAREVRIANLEAQLETYRRQLPAVVTRAVSAHQAQKAKARPRLSSTADKSGRPIK